MNKINKAVFGTIVLINFIPAVFMLSIFFAQLKPGNWDVPGVIINGILFYDFLGIHIIDTAALIIFYAYRFKKTGQMNKINKAVFGTIIFINIIPIILIYLIGAVLSLCFGHVMSVLIILTHYVSYVIHIIDAIALIILYVYNFKNIRNKKYAFVYFLIFFINILIDLLTTWFFLFIISHL